jgi:hypothetical protein
MWILPKSLISAFAQDTEALTSDLNECSQACAQSLMRRSKPSQSSAYLREWKAGNLMRLRSGAISSRFLGQSFLGWWTFSLAATRVSHLAPLESEPEQTIQDTSGPLLQVAFKWYDPNCVSSRTWRDTLALDLEKSLQTWKILVTKRRGEYSARLNAARLTSDAESTSLPTPCANEDSFRLSGNSQQSRCLEARARRGELGQPGPLNPEFVEVMMGLPIGWTDCACSETE